MGAPDQFAKTTFALDTAGITGGALRWEGPKEVGLTEVRLDGLLSVQAPERLAALPLPWCHARRHVDIGVEVKMPGDHLHSLAIWRAELRCAAWQVRRAEQEKLGWEGSVGFWTVAPHVPAALRRLRPVHAIGDGCYAVGIADSRFLWIAANELPLDEALIPFLIARSGKAFVEMARWMIGRRPPQWVASMLSSVAMDDATYLEILRQYPVVPDPRLLKQRTAVLNHFLQDPLVRERVMKPEREAARKEALKEARKEAREEARKVAREAAQDDARKSLRVVLAARELVPTPKQEARIDAQDDIDTLHRWLAQAVTAASVGKALT